MKKILFIAAAAIVAFSACNNGGIPKGSPKTDLDTLSYELGVANSQGVKMYIANQLGVDTAYMDEFYKGFAAAAQAGCTVTLRLNSQDGPAIGTAVIKSTGSADKYKTFSAKVSGATGVHDLYICFSKAQGDVRLDYWQFK